MADEPSQESIGAQDSLKRAITYTQKGLTEKVHTLINSRRGKLAQLTSKKKVIDNLMEDNTNLGTIEGNHLNVFNTLLSEFTDCNGKVLSFLPEEEHVGDQTDWFILKYDAFKKFAKWIEEWMEQARKDIESAKIGNEFDYKCDK